MHAVKTLLLKTTHQTIEINQMKYLLLLCLFASLLHAAPQDPPGILSGTFSTPTVALNRVGDNLFTITYSQAFNSVPYFGMAITKMTSIVSSRYILIPKIVSQTTSNINLNIYAPFNIWINLAYSWIASVSPALSTLQFSSNWPNNGAVMNKVFPASSLNIPPGTVKIDTLIAGFNYGATNNLFNIKVQPQGAIILTANTTLNQYNDPAVTSTPFNGFFIQTGNNITFPYVVSYEASAVRDFAELVITLVIHSVSFPTGSQSPVTSGFNTMTVTQQTSYINLFNPIANKNNLGVPTAQKFFGFTQISVTPPSASVVSPLNSTTSTAIGGIDIQVVVNTPFNSSIYSMSTISTVSTSYYFYENNAFNICPVSNIPSNTLISSNYNSWLCRTSNNTQNTGSCQAYSGTQNTYSVNIANTSPVALYIDLSTNIGTTYMITFYLLDGGSTFNNPQVTIRLGTQTVSRIVATNSSVWRSSTVSGTPTEAQIQSLGSYVQFTIFATASQSISRLEFQFADQTVQPALHTYYLKSVSVTSGNTIYNPITQMCVSSCLNNQMISTNTIPNVCTSCSDQGRVYDSTTGSCGCPVATYFNPATLTCVRCLESTCERCNPSNPAVCISCPTNRVLAGNRCSCAQGYLEVNGTCVVCNPGCTACTASPNICISCQPNSNRIQINGSCACVSGYYDVGQASCTLCPVSCLTCTNAQAAVPTPACTQCPANSNRVSTPINNDCPCLPGYTERTVRSQTCQSCHFSCATCTGPSSSQCSSCNFFANRIYSPNNAGGICVCATGFTDVGLPYCTNGTACTNIPGCVACTNGACSQCDSSQFKVFNSTQNRCICMNGYFQYNPTVTTDFTCIPCGLGCSQCTSGGICSQCYTGATNTGTGCQCPPGTYADQFSRSCQRCIGGCQTCSSQFTCTSCFSPLSLVQNTCTCPLGSYLVGSTCQNCPNLCQSCNATGQCVLCQTGFLLNNGSCVTTCPTQTYSNGYSCSPCPARCQTCTGPSTCQSCISPNILYSGLCLESCPDGTVVSTTTPLQCISCSSNCQRCSGTSTTCTSCSVGQVLMNNACASFCSAGSVSVGGSCIPCAPSCQTCFGSTTTCTSCANGFVVFPTGQCVASCPQGTYQSGTRCYPYTSCPPATFYNGTTCSACSTICATCSGTATNCTSCPRSTPYLQISTCTSSCSSGYYVYGNLCLQCDLSCTSCYSGAPGNCTSCAAGYTMGNIQGLCIPVCIGNSFNNGTGCQACPNSCAGCISSTNCIACASTSAVLVNGQCASCASPCQTCAVGSSSSCTSCVTGTYLSGISCVSICPIGQTSINGTCSCTTGYTYQSQCVSTCPVTTTPVNNVCQSCTAHCSSCLGSPTNCTQCSIGYTLVGNNCVLAPTCPYGQVPNDNTLCVSICPSGLLFYDTYCVTSCPTNYVPNNARSGCVYANSSVQKQCAVGLVFYNGLCLSSCPIGTFTSYGSCINCISNCAYCLSSSSCTSCTSGYYLSSTGTCILSTTCAPPQISFQGGCITSCPVGTYQQAFTCNRICEIGTYYYNGLCYYQTCPSGLFKSEYACVSSCPNGTTLSNGTCIGTSIITCPTGSYLTQSGACAACQTPCASCFGSPTSCTSCITGTLTGNSCTNNGGSGGSSLVLTIQSSSIFNNRVQVKILLSNLPTTLTQSQLNQLLNVVVFPNTQPPASVYQWPESGSSNVINVVIVFPTQIIPSTTIYFSINIPAVGSNFNQQGFNNFASASAQLPLSNVPRGSAMFSIPDQASPTAAMSPATQAAN